ncbi:MAG: ATP-binding protein [Thermoanaerobaculia bacterium]|jgi:PAS domain S-box-containing protein
MKRSNNESLLRAYRSGRRRAAIAFVIVAGMTLALFAAVVLPRQWRDARRSWEHELSSHADLYEAVTVVWVADRLAAARAIAALPRVVESLQGPVSDADAARLVALLGTFASANVFDEIVLYGGDGRSWSSRSRERSQSEAGCAVAARRAMELRSALVDIHRHEPGEIEVVFCAPVIVPWQEAPAGAVILETPASRWLYPFFASKTTSGRGTEALLVERHGQFVRFLTPLDNSSSPALATHRDIAIPGLAGAIAVEQGSASGEFVDYRGVPVLAATRHVEGTDWALVVKKDKDAIDRSIAKDLARNAALLVATLLAFGALLYVGAGLKERQTLRASVRLATVLNHANDAILFLDRDGRIEEVNRKAEHLYGRSEAELRSMSYSELRAVTAPGTPNEELSHVESSARRALRTMHRAADGTALSVEISSRWVETKDMRGFVVIVRDVSEVVAAEKEVRRLHEELEERVIERTTQLAEANRELESFSYSVSHDLRAPLRAISGFGRILAHDYGQRLDDEGRRLLEIVRSSTQRMGELIDDLLEYSRAGRRQLSGREVDMNPIVRNIAGELAGEAPTARFEIAELPSAWCDAQLIRLVWSNLLSNAVKFSSVKPDAAIEVGSLREPGRTVYYVRDNGVGFDMRYAGKLFGVFQRLHTQREFDGTGVGLALVQRIVRRHGGEAWGEGEVDVGATFYFSLPDRAPSVARVEG